MEARSATQQPGSSMPYYVIRAIFVLIFTYTSWKLGAAFDGQTDPSSPEQGSAGALAGIFIGMIGSGLLVAFEAYFSQHYLSLFYSVITGLLFGLLISVFFVQIIAYVPKEYIPDTAAGRTQKAIIGLLLTIFCCYLSVILVLRARNNYRLIIPFVELKQEGPQRKRLLLDTSVIIDGRLADICDTLIVDQAMFLPDFVLAAIHKIADSSDPLKRTRGRRGLDLLNRIRGNPRLSVEMMTTNYPEDATPERRLIHLAQEINGRVLTTDNNLHKLAQLQGIEVVNLHELENALRPVLLVGEQRVIKVLRPGEESDQGIGYLEDGTMVVIKGARHAIGREVLVSVTSVYQKQTGRMIFADFIADSSATSGDSADIPVVAPDDADDDDDSGASRKDRNASRSGRRAGRKKSRN